MSYRNLEIWQLAREVSIDVHRMTLTDLPKFELYEAGSQIRRSDYIKHLTYALGSCDETTDHLETLVETGSLTNLTLSESIAAKLQTLGRKLNLFIQSIDRAENTGPVRP